MSTITTLNHCQERINRLIESISTVIIGKNETIKLTLAAMLANGHVLYEDIPGTGKTMLVKSIAAVSGGAFQRIQFTADLLPSDILGISLYNNHKHEFEFRPGPIFADVILADEINRTTPRTQSALLEAMSERQVTIDGHTHHLSEQFFVIATQNPIDYQGTYPLPEAQLDRFLMKLSLGYPRFKEEIELLQGEDRNEALLKIDEALSHEDLHILKQFAAETFVDENLLEYALQLVHETRTHPKIKLGISTRGSLGFVNAAKALALCEGRSYCIPDDFKALVEPVFSHRLLLHSRHQDNASAVSDILNEIVGSVAVPVRIHK